MSWAFCRKLNESPSRASLPLLGSAFLRANPEAELGMVYAVMGLGRMTYNDEKGWRERHPLHVVRRPSEKFGFEFYSSAGSKDRFGIFGGANLQRGRI